MSHKCVEAQPHTSTSKLCSSGGALFSGYTQRCGIASLTCRQACASRSEQRACSGLSREGGLSQPPRGSEPSCARSLQGCRLWQPSARRCPTLSCYELSLREQGPHDRAEEDSKRGYAEHVSCVLHGVIRKVEQVLPPTCARTHSRSTLLAQASVRPTG